MESNTPKSTSQSNGVFSMVASWMWLICIFVLIVTVLVMGVSGFEALWVLYGIVGMLAILFSSMISPLFGLEDPYMIGGIMLYVIIGILVVIALTLTVIVITGLAKKRRSAWWIPAIISGVGVTLYGIGYLANPSLSNFLFFALHGLVLYLLVNVRQYFGRPV